MVGMAFVVGIVHTFHRFAVYADGLAGMHHGALKGIHALPSLGEALAAGFLTAAGLLSAYHDIAFAAAAFLIIATIFHTTF